MVNSQNMIKSGPKKKNNKKCLLSECDSIFLLVLEAVLKFVSCLKLQYLAMKHGLILVDTKYEFGKASDGSILLIDEVNYYISS